MLTVTHKRGLIGCPSRADPCRDDDIDKVANVIGSLPEKPEMVLALMSNRDKSIYAGLHCYFDLTGLQSLFGPTGNMLDKEGRDQ